MRSNKGHTQGQREYLGCNVHGSNTKLNLVVKTTPVVTLDQFSYIKINKCKSFVTRLLACLEGRQTAVSTEFTTAADSFISIIKIKEKPSPHKKYYKLC